MIKMILQKGEISRLKNTL